VNATGPKNFTPIHIANARHDALVEHGFSNCGIGIVVVKKPRSTFVYIRVGASKVWSKSTRARMPRLIELSVGLYRLCLERNSSPIVSLNNDAHLVSALAPFSAGLIHMPCSTSTKLSLQHNAIVKDNL
jgi:hypothetical protein